MAQFTGPASISYGFGLFAEDDPAFGTIVQHSGGYPGYGSQMRWHPATGLGTVVLANGTYAHAGALAGELLAALLAAQAPQAAAERGPVHRARPAARRRPSPWPETLAARDAVNDLLQDWDDDVAGQPVRAERRAGPAAGRSARRRSRSCASGSAQFAADPDRPAEFDSPAHCRWWLTGERGTVAVQIKLAPLRQPLVQQLVLAVPPAPGSAPGSEALRQLVEALNAGAPNWPAGLRDCGRLRRRPALRAAARSPPPGPASASSTATWPGTAARRTHRAARSARPATWC